MADREYGGYRREGGRGRDSSIFSDDDDRWSRGSERGSTGAGRERGRDDDRGFFERAGDEIRSWFGDEEAERRRERDIRRDEARGAFGGRDYEGRYATRTQYGPGGYGAYESGRGAFGWGRDEGGPGRGGIAGRSQWDDNYRQWRERQLEQLDRDYEDYCRERQQQFDRDFDSWRTSRLTEGGFDAAGGSSQKTAGAATAGGGGTASATPSSTGTTGASETTGSGRGGSRTRA